MSSSARVKYGPVATADGSMVEKEFRLSGRLGSSNCPVDVARRFVVRAHLDGDGNRFAFAWAEREPVLRRATDGRLGQAVRNPVAFTTDEHQQVPADSASHRDVQQRAGRVVELHDRAEFVRSY